MWSQVKLCAIIHPNQASDSTSFPFRYDGYHASVRAHNWRISAAALARASFSGIRRWRRTGGASFLLLMREEIFGREGERSLVRPPSDFSGGHGPRADPTWRDSGLLSRGVGVGVMSSEEEGRVPPLVSRGSWSAAASSASTFEKRMGTSELKSVSMGTEVALASVSSDDRLSAGSRAVH